ncbi:MAG: hypothetical protein IPO43_05185, partial [Rhodoferax sp.]|nr:hypothetical protein [Rhodoferax sp.]
MVYTVTAEDGSTQSYTVTVANALISNAGNPQNVATNSVVTLDGSASIDPNGDAVTLNWQLISKPNGSVAALSNSTSIKPSFTADLEGNYSLSLTITDGKSSSLSVTAIIATPTVFTSNATYHSASVSSGNWSALSRRVSVMKIGAPWDVSLSYNNVSVDAGKTYSIAIDCSNKYSSTYMIRILPKNQNGVYGLQYAKCDGHEAIIKFTAPISDTTARIELCFGSVLGDVLGESPKITSGSRR